MLSGNRTARTLAYNLSLRNTTHCCATQFVTDHVSAPFSAGKCIGEQLLQIGKCQKVTQFLYTVRLRLSFLFTLVKKEKKNTSE